MVAKLLSVELVQAGFMGRALFKAEAKHALSCKWYITFEASLEGTSACLAPPPEPLVLTGHAINFKALAAHIIFTVTLCWHCQSNARYALRIQRAMLNICLRVRCACARDAAPTCHPAWTAARVSSHASGSSGPARAWRSAGTPCPGAWLQQKQARQPALAHEDRLHVRGSLGPSEHTGQKLQSHVDGCWLPCLN